MQKQMRSYFHRVFAFALMSLLALGVFASMAQALWAASVDPIHIPGPDNTNKTCAVVMPGTIELKIEPVATGDASDGLLNVSIIVPSTAGTPNSFDWTSNINVLGVIVKDGVDGANWYDYSPGGTTGDTNLQTPNNGDKGISHISFCYRPALSVTKDAETSFTRTFEWEIDKSVVPDTWDLFTGDSGISDYTVTVTKVGFTDSDWAVNGTITIHNPHPSQTATIESVADSINGIVADVECNVGFPHALPAGGTLECTYSADLPDGADRTNTATVTTSGAIDGGTANADVIFGEPTTVIDDTINVTDSFAGDLGSFSDSGSAFYSRTFTCDGDEGIHDNTATIVETGQSDDASVVVNCYALDVTKDAETAFTRTWEWTIAKSADETELLLSEGQLLQVNYVVTVDASFTDSDHAVSGNIWIANPNPILAAELTAVSDVVSPDIAATVDCPALVIPAGESLHCTYSADLPDDQDRVNTATASLQNYDYDSEGVGTPSGTTDFSGNAAVAFDNADLNEIDECVDVSDTNVGDLGTVCSGDAPAVFNYSLFFGTSEDADVQLVCGDNFHTNIASFETNDTGTTGAAEETVNAHVECVVGCTLTPGYWKTHSDKGPAPFDDTWDLLPNGSDTIFFLSGQTYYEVLWTNPQGGNAYYILAHAYIAAELNQLNGADFSAVQDAFDEATGLFEAYTPEQIGALKGKNPLRQQFLKLATILDDYNNGLIGPGHCSEDSNSFSASSTGLLGAQGANQLQTTMIFVPVVDRN